jgi:epoxide hydrolase-like predicted phosphatase
MNKTELVIFDLGNVLVDFDFRKVVTRLKEHTAHHSEKEIKEYFSKTALWDRFERGQVSPEDFFGSLKEDLKLDTMEFQQFIPAWNDIFIEKPDTIAILNRLRGRYKLAMISNVNKMHWDHILLGHSFMEWFDHRVASYEVGHRKPDREIYELTLNKMKVPASRAIFIDDLHINITGAQSVGIRAHLFHTAEKLQTDLEDILK